jgi:hypothetical protein
VVTRLKLYFALALTALSMAVPASAQVVEGRVVDVDGAAVSGAAVQLLDAEYRPVVDGLTDPTGSFWLQAPAAGRYLLVTQLEGYASQTSEPLDLETGETLEHRVVLQGQRVGESRLAVTDTLDGAQLMARAVADACRDRFLPAMHGILFGVVIDSATSEPLPGAEAVVRFSDPTGLSGGGALRGRTDENGIYLVCDAPAGRELTVRAESLGMQGDQIRTRLRSGTMRKVDLTLAVSDPDMPGAIFGKVTDENTGNPIAGAEVRVRNEGVGTITNERGVFRLPDVPRGLQVLTVDHLGHGHHEQAMRILGGQAVQVDVRMSIQPIEMAPMLVRVRPRRWFSDMSALEDRIANGFGFIITEDELEEREPRHIADALRAVPGVRVRQSGGTVSGTYTVQMRGAQTLDGRPCAPVVWIDGQKLGREPDLLTSIFGPDLYAIEVYRSSAETPGEFSDQDANCGVIVAWTKRGR